MQAAILVPKIFFRTKGADEEKTDKNKKKHLKTFFFSESRFFYCFYRFLLVFFVRAYARYFGIIDCSVI